MIMWGIIHFGIWRISEVGHRLEIERSDLDNKMDALSYGSVKK